MTWLMLCSIYWNRFPSVDTLIKIASFTRCSNHDGSLMVIRTESQRALSCLGLFWLQLAYPKVSTLIWVCVTLNLDNVLSYMSDMNGHRIFNSKQCEWVEQLNCELGYGLWLYYVNALLNCVPVNKALAVKHTLAVCTTFKHNHTRYRMHLQSA